MAFSMASLGAALPVRLRRTAAPAKTPLLVSWEGGFRRLAGVTDTAPAAGASPDCNMIRCAHSHVSASSGSRCRGETGVGSVSGFVAAPRVGLAFSRHRLPA
jgi:hypothetical protein